MTLSSRAALAHKTPDAVQAAYRRTTYLGTEDKPGARVNLMGAWGNYCLGREAVTKAGEDTDVGEPAKS
jgi:hypothetical protein